MVWVDAHDDLTDEPSRRFSGLSKLPTVPGLEVRKCLLKQVDRFNRNQLGRSAFSHACAVKMASQVGLPLFNFDIRCAHFNLFKGEFDEDTASEMPVRIRTANDRDMVVAELVQAHADKDIAFTARDGKELLLAIGNFDSVRGWNAKRWPEPLPDVIELQILNDLHNETAPRALRGSLVPWVQSGASLGPVWGQSRSSLGPVWVQFGSSLGPVWVQFGSSLVPAWV